MTTYVLTITSLSGRKINIARTETFDSMAVYSKKDLERRLKEVAKHPDLRAHVREVRS